MSLCVQCQHTVPTTFSRLWQASLSFHALGDNYTERHAKDKRQVFLCNMTKALATLGHLTASITGTSNPLMGAVLAGLTEARTAARQHWHDAAATACDSMRSASGTLALTMTPSWRKHLPANADWQILVNTCGDAIRVTDISLFQKCREAVFVIW